MVLCGFKLQQYCLRLDTPEGFLAKLAHTELQPVFSQLPNTYFNVNVRLEYLTCMFLDHEFMFSDVRQTAASKSRYTNPHASNVY